MQFDALFLKKPTEDDVTAKDKLQALANLSHVLVLQESLDTSIRCAVVDALTLLTERKFEEAYASLIGAGRVQELKDLFEESKKQVEQQSVKETDTPRDGIKY